MDDRGCLVRDKIQSASKVGGKKSFWEEIILTVNFYVLEVRPSLR